MLRSRVVVVTVAAGIAAAAVVLHSSRTWAAQEQAGVPRRMTGSRSRSDFGSRRYL